MATPRNGRSALTSLIVAAAVALGACAGSSATGSADVPTTDSATVDATTAASAPVSETASPATPTTTADTRMLVDEILALPDDERDARIAALSSDYELQVAKLSGLEDALGGPEAAAAELGAAWGALVDQIRATAAQPIQFGLRSAAARADGPSIGEGLFGTIITVGLLGDAAVKASNTAEAGVPLQTVGDKATNYSGSLTEAGVNVDVTFNGDKVTTKLKVQMKVLPCPDPNGHFTAEATATISATSGSVGQTGTLEVKAAGDVDDDANLVGVSTDYRMQWADFAGGKGKFADVSGGTGKIPILNRSGGSVTPEFAVATNAMGQFMGLLIGVLLVEQAEKGRQSGRCVKINTTAAPGPTGMDPGSTSAVTAAPRSKVDGAATGGTVTATLVSGGKAVDPAAIKVKADASFTYSAPDEKDQGGTVALEARSKRGVGKAEIAFDTKGGSYVATYSGGDITINVPIADLTEPFETYATVIGGEITLRYTPSSDEGGSVSHKDPCGPGCVAKGSGTYTITDSGAGDGTKFLTVTIHSCVTVTAVGKKQEICNDRVMPILLTPA